MKMKRCARAVAAAGCVLGAALSGCASFGKPTMAVSVPVTDLRSEPGTTAQPGVHDPQQETQLIYGERVRVHKLQQDWAYVEALEQPELTHTDRWQGYPGWVPVSALFPLNQGWTPNVVVTEKWATGWQDDRASLRAPWRFPMGTRLRADDRSGNLWRIKLLDGNVVWLVRDELMELEELDRLPPEEKRERIVRNAQRLVGDAYYWGGRSPMAIPATDQMTGVDCSALINLAYRTVGMTIPRDAHEQFLRARRVKTPQIADLIFLSERDHPRTIVHVMLYAGDEEVIEGPGTGLAVRRISLLHRLGRPLARLTNGTVVEGQTVYFGRYVRDYNLIRWVAAPVLRASSY